MRGVQGSFGSIYCSREGTAGVVGGCKCGCRLEGCWWDGMMDLKNKEVMVGAGEEVVVGKELI